MIKAPDGAYFHPTYHKLAALFVHKGDAAITNVMADLTDDDIAPAYPNISLVQSGILSTVLSSLRRCEHETFDGVLVDARGHLLSPNNGAFIPNVGGDLESPSIWIDILSTASRQEPSCMLHIAENIGPLVKCMCNDTERLFFKNNAYWKEGIVRFVELMSKMVYASNWNDPNNKVVDVLLQHDGLMRSIIQWGYWTEHRPDIVNAIPSELKKIVNCGEIVTMILVSDAYDRKERALGSVTTGIDRLLMFGTTPIISKQYDPTCMVSYTEGLIHQAKRERGVKTYFNTLIVLVKNEAGCIDKGGKIKPNDTPVAFAVRAGLVEMCLGFVEQFGGGEAFGDVDGGLFHLIHRVISMINDVSFQKKTWKAIRHKKISIKEKLDQLERNTDFTNIIKYKKLLDMVRSIIHMNCSYCCRCNKSLSRTEVKQCNGCSSMAYCSRACQKEDWSNGHKLACCKSYTADLAGQFQGRVTPVVGPDDERLAAKLKELEINSSMIQLKLFLDNSETILSQADSFCVSLCNCVVKFELRECPPTIDILNYTDYFRNSSEAIKGFRETRSEENITCVYYSRISMRGLDESLLITQKLYPHQWLLKQNK